MDLIANSKVKTTEGKGVGAHSLGVEGLLEFQNRD
jgi:hypothetical protein